jgi:hypothetical protein
VAAGAALALPSTGLGGVAAIQDDVLTVPTSDVSARLNLVAKTKAKVSRFDILWSYVATRQPVNPQDPADPAYNWTHVDQVLTGLDQLGITPIVSTYSTPPFAQATRATGYKSAYNPNAPTPTAFGAFMKAVATRYSGTYPKAGGGVLPRVRHFEVWNEPNLAGFLAPQSARGRRVALPRYVAMTRRAYRAVKRAQRGAIVIAGAAGPRSSTGVRGTGALAWARALARSRAPFDAYSQHVYPAAPPRAPTRAFPAWRTLGRLFDVLDAVPRRRGTPVYLTEVGYTTARTPFRRVRVSRAQQARYLRQIASSPVVRRHRVRALIWFNLQDNPNWPGGLRDLRGRPKPSLRAFVRLARGSRLTPDLRAGRRR